MLHSIEVYIPFMGFDAYVAVDFYVTSWGSPARIDQIFGGEPAEDPEYEIDNIGVTLDLDGGLGAEWFPQFGARQFRLLANHPRVEQAIIDCIVAEKPSRRRRAVNVGDWD